MEGVKGLLCKAARPACLKHPPDLYRGKPSHIKDIQFADFSPIAVGMQALTLTATVSEDGTTLTDSFTVELKVRPDSNVVLTVSSSDPGEVTVSPAVLTFEPDNWDTPQSVNLTGTDDDLIDGNQISSVTVSVDDANSDDRFDTVDDQTVSVTTRDDDATGLTLVEIDGGNMVVSDIDPAGGKPDNLTISYDDQTSKYVISDPDNVITVRLPGLPPVDANVVRVPLSAFPGGSVIVQLEGGDDRLTIESVATPVDVFAGSDDDTIALGAGVQFTGTVDGQSGSDTLDYRAWTTPVNVNLSGQALPVAGGTIAPASATGIVGTLAAGD